MYIQIKRTNHMGKRVINIVTKQNPDCLAEDAPLTPNAAKALTTVSEGLPFAASRTSFLEIQYKESTFISYHKVQPNLNNITKRCAHLTSEIKKLEQNWAQKQCDRKEGLD